MAGYVFAIGQTEDVLAAIRECAERGVYSTYIRSISPMSFEGTLADYMSMKPGDYVFFFCKRKYYGVGELISVGPDCKYCNYPDSSRLENHNYDEIQNDALIDFGEETPHYRWLCTFRGSPHFFENGLDADEILLYKPETFKMLRAFWRVSFIKLGDEESESLKEIFLLKHQHELATGEGLLPMLNDTHTTILNHDLARYVLSSNSLLETTTRGSTVKHEMALEVAVVHDLMNDAIPQLGHWDYVSHQVIASPFKPVDYMDRMDVFASRYIDGTKIPCKYLVAELKKDFAYTDTIDQILKYVDWIKNEYAYGDYSFIEACIIASGYDEQVPQHFQAVVKRYFSQGSHPVQNKEWFSVKLLQYEYRDGALSYIDITPDINGVEN